MGNLGPTIILMLCGIFITVAAQKYFADSQVKTSIGLVGDLDYDPLGPGLSHRFHIRDRKLKLHNEDEILNFILKSPDPKFPVIMEMTNDMKQCAPMRDGFTWSSSYDKTTGIYKQELWVPANLQKRQAIFICSQRDIFHGHGDNAFETIVERCEVDLVTPCHFGTQNCDLGDTKAEGYVDVVELDKKNIPSLLPKIEATCFWV